MKLCSWCTAQSSLSFTYFGVLLLLFVSAGARADQQFSTGAAAVDTVLRLADERMSLMPGVAAFKWEKKAPILDPERERAVTTNAVEQARVMGLAPEGVQAVFELQVRAARESQERLHETWRATGFDFPGPIPSLERDVRPRLDRFTGDFLRALYLAAPEFARPDFTTAYAGRIDTLRAPGWTDSDKRALLEALAKVRTAPAGTGAETPGLLKRISSTGTLRVGTTGDYAPFTLEHEGSLSGADIDLAQSLAKRLGVTPVFVKTSWTSMLEDLKADKFDIAIGGVSVTPARAAVAAFSVPYASGGKTILARCEDAKRFRGLAAVDRRGVRVIVNPGGTNEQYVKANVHKATVVTFPDNRGIFDEIRARRADVMITDDAEVELQTHRHPELCRALPGTLTKADKAILMPKDAELLASVNAWLTEAIKTGEPARLLDEQWRR